MLFPSTLSMQLRLVLLLYCSLFKLVNSSFKKQKLNCSIGVFFSLSNSKAELSFSKSKSLLSKSEWGGCLVRTPLPRAWSYWKSRTKVLFFKSKKQKRKAKLLLFHWRFLVPFSRTEKSEGQVQKKKPEGQFLKQRRNFYFEFQVLKKLVRFLKRKGIALLCHW